MSYKSPYTLIAGLVDPSVTEITEEVVVRLRKKLLAEFNLTQHSTITLNGHEYTKDAVLKLVDSLRYMSNAAAHLQIYRNKKVLAFLEDPQDTAHTDRVVFDWIHSPETSFEVRVFLHEAIIERLKALFAKRNYPELQGFTSRLLECKDEVLLQEFESTLYKHHILNITHIEEAVVASKKEIPKHLHWLYQMGWVNYYNSLDEKYPFLIEEIMPVCINFTVMLHRNRFNKSHLLRISNNLLMLKSTGENRKISFDNHRAFMDREQVNAPAGLRIALFIGVFILLAVSRTCLRSHSVQERRIDLPKVTIPDMDSFTPDTTRYRMAPVTPD